MKFKYLIIGGGPCSDSAVKGIREHDKEGKIGIISNEHFGPYRRLSLTKQVWKDGNIDTIMLGTEKYNVTILTDTCVNRVVPEKKMVFANEKEFEYEKLLIATGITPRKLPFKEASYFRTINDFQHIYSQIGNIEKLLIIGGGFTGLELAAEIKAFVKEVFVIFPENYVVKRFVPKEISEIIMSSMKSAGVELITGDSVKDISGKNIVTNNGKSIKADLIIASIGNAPNVDFLEGSGIKVSNGVEVNSFCETNKPDIYSAGDVAFFPSQLFETNMRREFMDNAIKQGKIAGFNMAGAKIEYNPILYTFFDCFDVGYRGFGEYSSAMDMSLCWLSNDKKEALIFYREKSILKGILFWNGKPNMKIANHLIMDKSTLSNNELIKQILG